MRDTITRRDYVIASTWYELAIHPRGYWSLWADCLVHAIHLRVLEHVKDLSESGT